MPPSRRRERRVSVPRGHMVSSVTITSGQQLGVPKGYRRPKPQRPAPGALVEPNPAAAVVGAGQAAGQQPMTGGLAPKPDRPQTTQEQPRGPVTQLNRLWKDFFGGGQGGQGGGQGGGPQGTPIGPGPGGAVPDIKVLPSGSFEYTDALSGRTVVIGPRSNQSDFDSVNRVQPGGEMPTVLPGGSTVTKHDEGRFGGPYTVTGPEPERQPPADKPVAEVPQKPLSKEKLADIAAAFKSVRSGAEQLALYDSYVEELGDRFLESEYGRKLDEVVMIRRQIFAEQAKEAGVKAAQVARGKLEARQRRQQTVIKGIAGIYRRKAEDVKNPEELAALRAEMRDAAGLRGLEVTDEDLDRAGFIAPTEEQMTDRTWKPVVAKLSKSFAGRISQKKLTTQKQVDEAFMAETKGWPQAQRDQVVIPKLAKAKPGIEGISPAQALTQARRFIAGSGTESSDVLGPDQDRRATEYVSLERYKTLHEVEDLAARSLIMRGSMSEGRVPGAGEKAQYPGLLKRYKGFERWANTGGEWSPSETKKAWLRVLRESGREDLEQVWLRWKGHDSDEWKKASAGAAAEAKAGAGRRKPTPADMQKAFEETNSKEEARELLRKQGFDI